MTPLDKKANEFFPGLVVRKDLVKTVKGNAIVPSYVLEYLLGQYCATSDEESIKSGIESVKEILGRHYVHRNESGLIKSVIREKGRHKVIDKISAALNDKKDVYEASFANLGINKVLVDPDTVKKHPKMLVSGVWSIVDLEYEYFEDKSLSPWIINQLKPIQLSYFDYDNYIEARKKFTTDEWIDLLVQSIGFNPEKLDKRRKLLQLVRLIPFCERNYNLIELGPKGTGKSHIFSDFSPHGILISGGEVSVPKLFVNNSSGKIGLVGYWDCVAFDEFAGRKKNVKKDLVDIMKNYMANKTFSRGVETIGAEASMVFVGNTKHPLDYMLKHTDLFDELPENYYDSAFLDRIHFYLPGWEVDIIRGEMFSKGYGFVVDYLAEILRFLRNHDFSDRYYDLFSLNSDISTRDKDAVNKTFSGMMKILFPHGGSNEKEIEDILYFAVEGRKRVKEQLYKIDSTYPHVSFEYKKILSKKTVSVKTKEEIEYKDCLEENFDDENEKEDEKICSDASLSFDTKIINNTSENFEPKENHLKIEEFETGITYDKLFGPYFQNSKRIVITEPYIRIFFQIRNFMEFIETIIKFKPQNIETEVHLITIGDEFRKEQQEEFFAKIQENTASAKILFTWEFDLSQTIHARHIITDDGWKILLDRGLDIFQNYEMNDSFNLENRIQSFRKCKQTEITFLKI
jgi:ATP-dependent Lon protease